MATQIQAHPQSTLTGLTSSEVLARRERGEGNNVKIPTSRSYKDIIVNNVLNPINAILFALGAVMIIIGKVGDAVSSAGLILLNVVIGIFQEIRAKRQLDHIALLTLPKITVLRDSQEQTVNPSELVLGDIIILRPGDQIAVDGVMLGEGKIEVDESLLTGESDLVPKVAGDELLSGSYCVTGSAMFEATRVGEASFANKLTANARKFQVVQTPLQHEINILLRFLMLLASFIGGLMLVATIISAVPFMRQVQMAAVIVGLVPVGLFFMVIVAYAIGALRIVRQGALVQQSNAVESLSNVTVLCTDKTGTLTANKINYNDAYTVGIEKQELERILGDFARSASTNNKTGEALATGLEGTKHPFTDEVPFSSERKWSAIAFDNEHMKGVYVLGALEMLEDHLKQSSVAGRQSPEDNSAPGTHHTALKQLQEWSKQGLRVLVFAHNPDVTTLHDTKDEPVLPELTLLGVVSFKDELRPHLRETLDGFAKNGIRIKIISGDNPQTVAALAKQAGFAGDLTFVSGTDLAKMEPEQFKQAAENSTVFGRITPEQKEALVSALREQGHYVAMIGDGVNDVLSLKKANMGIAMESGSAATRGVADMVLLGDSFAALPPAFTEGQRIINGMKDILRLFLTRVLYSALLIIAIAFVNLGFPFVPKHNALMVLFTVGIPTFALALWARPGPLPRRSIIREIIHFVFPAAISIFTFAFFVYIAAFYLGIAWFDNLNITQEDIQSFQRYAGIDYDISAPTRYILEVSQLVAQSAVTTFLVFAGLLLVVFVEPPIKWFVAGDEFSGDWRPTILAGVLLVAYFGIVAVEPARRVFELIDLPLYGYGLIVLAVVLWAVSLRFIWRRRWLERFLEVEI